MSCFSKLRKQSGMAGPQVSEKENLKVIPTAVKLEGFKLSEPSMCEPLSDWQCLLKGGDGRDKYVAPMVMR